MELSLRGIFHLIELKTDFSRYPTWLLHALAREIKARAANSLLQARRKRINLSMISDDDILLPEISSVSSFIIIPNKRARVRCREIKCSIWRH